MRAYVDRRVPSLAKGSIRFTRADVHLYAVVRTIAERFWAPGVVLIGDAAHQTHPSGATGMNLAVAGAAHLSELLVPALQAPTIDPSTVDAALRAYSDERRPAAHAAAAHNHAQGGRTWWNDVHLDPYTCAKNSLPVTHCGRDDIGEEIGTPAGIQPRRALDEQRQIDPHHFVGRVPTGRCRRCQGAQRRPPNTTRRPDGAAWGRARFNRAPTMPPGGAHHRTAAQRRNLVARHGDHGCRAEDPAVAVGTAGETAGRTRPGSPH
ncbi:MAG: FAD-dependent oxidoreductase [Chloroflexota bacterium]